MDDISPQGLRKPAPPGAGPGTAGQPGVIGIAFAAVLTVSFASGSWQWFATCI
ncbi:hypothetical protein [Streptomyces sp. NPDC002889]|uniref:hypothetical protein n=1 Tax=Streptomyces sp. NPDC002889 TaxID=3364669 RepID=UPI0036BEF66A